MSKIEIYSGLEVSMKILELLKQRNDLKSSINIGCFTNCREQGFTYIVNNTEGYFTFCTYEHRNSDQIIINGCKGLISMNGDLPYNGDSKYDYLASFSYNDFDGAVNKLVELINEKAGI